MVLDTLVEILAPFAAKLQSKQSGSTLSCYLGNLVCFYGATNCRQKRPFYRPKWLYFELFPAVKSFSDHGVYLKCDRNHIPERFKNLESSVHFGRDTTFTLGKNGPFIGQNACILSFSPPYNHFRTMVSVWNVIGNTFRSGLKIWNNRFILVGKPRLH